MVSLISSNTGTGLALQPDASGQLQFSTGYGGTQLTLANNVLTMGSNVAMTMGDGTQWYTAQSLGTRNRIINGAMQISQRGTSFGNPTSGTGYTLDRWATTYDGTNGTFTISQQALTLGDLNPFQYFLQWAQTVANSNSTYVRLQQKIENLTQFSGQTIAISFYAKCSTSISILVRADRYFGTGGSPSSPDNQGFVGAQTATVTTSWQRFTFVAFITSLAGKTLGTNNDSYLLVGIDLPTSGTFTLSLTGFQVEMGTVATPFEFRQFGTELQLCQRYFQMSYPLGTAIGSATTSGEALIYASNSTTNALYGAFVYPVRMRTTPTLTAYAGTTGTSGNFYNYSAGANTASQFGRQSETGFSVEKTVPNAPGTYGFNWTASAEI
jgi:hypothetical protein